MISTALAELGSVIRGLEKWSASRARKDQFGAPLLRRSYPRPEISSVSDANPVYNGRPRPFQRTTSSWTVEPISFEIYHPELYYIPKISTSVGPQIHKKTKTPHNYDLIISKSTPPLPKSPRNSRDFEFSSRFSVLGCADSDHLVLHYPLEAQIFFLVSFPAVLIREFPPKSTNYSLGS